MLGNIIGLVLVGLVAFSLFGTLSQEIDNAINCNITNNSLTIESESPLGSTDSFGGGGSGHFGGYDGTVKKSWGSNLAPYKTNATIINKDCESIEGTFKILLSIIPLLFVVAILGVGISVAYSAFKEVGTL